MTFIKVTTSDIVYDREQELHGKVIFINRQNHSAKVEVITNKNLETGERTTKLVECGLSNLILIERKPPKQTTDLNLWWQWVRKFHLAFNHPAPDKPTMLTEERIMKRNSWMQEECQEMLEAKTLEDQVDAAIDKLYFALGDLVELGVKPNNLLRIVQRANMGKLHNVDGKLIPVYKEDGKIKKPDDWEAKFAPEEKLKEEIARQFKKK